MNPMTEEDSAEKGEMQESNTSDDVVMQMTNDNSSSITQVDSSFKVHHQILETIKSKTITNFFHSQKEYDSNKGNPLALDDESVDKIVMLDGDNAQMDIGVEMNSDNANQCTEFSEHLIAQDLQRQDNSESVTEEHFQAAEPMEESESLPMQEQSEATNNSESNDNAEVMETNEAEDARIEQTSSEFLPEKNEPDTEAVSEDELPQESTKVKLIRVFSVFFSVFPNIFPLVCLITTNAEKRTWKSNKIFPLIVLTPFLYIIEYSKLWALEIFCYLSFFSWTTYLTSMDLLFIVEFCIRN